MTSSNVLLETKIYKIPGALIYFKRLIPRAGIFSPSQVQCLQITNRYDLVTQKHNKAKQTRVLNLWGIMFIQDMPALPLQNCLYTPTDSKHAMLMVSVSVSRSLPHNIIHVHVLWRSFWRMLQVPLACIKCHVCPICCRHRRIILGNLFFSMLTCYSSVW